MVSVDVRPATWDGFTTVMGEKGGCGGCWCMLWRLSHKEWQAGLHAPNRAAMEALFATGRAPGLIGWVGDMPVAWIQVDERSAFKRLAGSRVLKPVDDTPVWSVACFFIHRNFRRQGVSVPLLEAACDFARAHGATVIEGYPIDTPKSRYPVTYAWTGFLGTFRAAGFTEVARRSETRPIMRRSLA